jgi:hypothetical protein
METLDANEARHWRKSSHSYNDDCVECRCGPGHVQIRDSKNCAGPVLFLPRSGWTAFMTTVTRA